MAEKKGKKKQDSAYRKEANTEFHKGADNAFTGGGNAAYQPRDSGIGKPGRSSGGKRQTEKSMQAQQETFGQKVQKKKYRTSGHFVQRWGQSEHGCSFIVRKEGAKRNGVNERCE